jgi:hypothetical protein
MRRITEDKMESAIRNPRYRSVDFASAKVIQDRLGIEAVVIGRAHSSMNAFFVLPSHDHLGGERFIIGGSRASARCRSSRRRLRSAISCSANAPRKRAGQPSSSSGVKLAEVFAIPDLDREVKWHCRYAHQNGIHVSPTFMIDGLVQTDMSSGDPVADWVARLSDH